MIVERLRLMYLPKEGTGIKQLSLSGRQVAVYGSILSICFICFIVLMIGVTTRLFQSYQIHSLEKDRNQLQNELVEIKEKVSALNSRLAQIEQTGDELRNVANLPPINNDVRKVGIGGPGNFRGMDFMYYSDEIQKTALEINLDLNKLERAISLEKNSMLEISTELSEQVNRLDHLPSIMPILGGRITDEFGFRFHPLTRRRQFHKGVDIPMPKGTRVLAAADGVIERIETNHKEYGLYIIVDHGFGYETKYCHLSNVLVKRGQKVKRWDPIGEVGQSGRTTGYHLHYEVVSDGKRQDPEHYIYN